MLLDPIPLLPQPDAARQWLVDELSHPRYAEAQPTWFDIMATAIRDFFLGLFDGPADGAGSSVIMIVIGAVIVALAVMAVLIWGHPRLRRRSAGIDDALFDGDDERSADELRRASEAAAATSDFDTAVVLRLRAIARALRERGAVSTGPGATVHAFAIQGARAFPAHAAELEAAATGFDDVRYLRRPGTPELFASMRALDRALASTRPVALVAVEELV